MAGRVLVWSVRFVSGSGAQGGELGLGVVFSAPKEVRLDLFDLRDAERVALQGDQAAALISPFHLVDDTMSSSSPTPFNPCCLKYS